MEPLLQDLRSDRRKLMKRPFVFAGIFAGIIALVFLVSSAAVNNSLKNQPIAEVHFDTVLGGMVFFAATVNSAGPFQFLLDTGGSGVT